MRLEPHSGLTAVLPENALSSDVGACAFPDHQGFFIGEAVPTEKTTNSLAGHDLAIDASIGHLAPADGIGDVGREAKFFNGGELTLTELGATSTSASVVRRYEVSNPMHNWHAV